MQWLPQESPLSTRFPWAREGCHYVSGKRPVQACDVTKGYTPSAQFSHYRRSIKHVDQVATLLLPPAGSTNEGGGKSRLRFAAKRGGAFFLYTIPLSRLLGDG